MVTPIDISAIINMIIPLIFLVLIISVLMSLMKEFKAGGAAE
ncbi:MAG: hypothetical protein QXO00_02460 [Candidatus Bathyarchaeia archaeon]